MKVCDHLNLLEKDYYGLTIWETLTMKVSEILHYYYLVCLLVLLVSISPQYVDVYTVCKSKCWLDQPVTPLLKLNLHLSCS